MFGLQYVIAVGIRLMFNGVNNYSLLSFVYWVMILIDLSKLTLLMLASMWNLCLKLCKSKPEESVCDCSNTFFVLKGFVLDHMISLFLFLYGWVQLVLY